MTYPGLAVHLPSLREAPGMLERLADSSKRCWNYAQDAFELDFRGPGLDHLLPGSGPGLINTLLGTHGRLRDEVLDYFDDVRSFSNGQGERVAESVEIYRETDEELAATMDQSLWSIDVQAIRREAEERGRASVLDLDRPQAVRLEQNDPVDALRPLVDYRADLPFVPAWAGESSPVGKIRDTIWQVTSWAADLGLISRPYDVITELVKPFTGDWAALKACGDALENLGDAAAGLTGNAGWVMERSSGTV